MLVIKKQLICRQAEEFVLGIRSAKESRRKNKRETLEIRNISTYIMQDASCWKVACNFAILIYVLYKHNAIFSNKGIIIVISNAVCGFLGCVRICNIVILRSNISIDCLDTFSRKAQGENGYRSTRISVVCFSFYRVGRGDIQGWREKVIHKLVCDHETFH